MITKAECYERQAQCNSVYRSMLNSGNAADKANAEAYRLASQEWANVAANMPGTERGGSASNMLNSREVFDPQIHVDSLQHRWRHYLTFGRGHDDLDTMVLTNQQEIIKSDRVRRRMAAIMAESVGVTAPEAKVQADKEWADGKAKWVKDAKQSLASQAGGAMAYDPRHHVDPTAIVGIINEFRHVLGLPVPDPIRPGIA